MKFECPCCGYKTFDEPAIGTFDICGLCGWEVDSVQSTDPDYEGGPNGISMREAQYEFINSEPDSMEFERSEDWKPLDPPSEKTRLKNAKTNFIVDTTGTVKDV